VEEGKASNSSILFLILISSLGSAIILPHFLHFDVSNGSYIEIITLTLGSGEDYSCFVCAWYSYSMENTTRKGKTIIVP